MFQKIKEIIRESQALTSVNSEFKLVCPDTVEQKKLFNSFSRISQKVQCPHNMSHVLTFVVEMMKYTKKHSESKGVYSGPCK